MNTFSVEERDWASRLAAQVRVVQSDCAEQSGEERQTLIAEEIQRELKTVASAKRKVYLEALTELFPTGEADSAPSTASAPAGRADESPDELVDRLTALAPSLPLGKLLELGVRLQQAGFIEMKQARMGDAPPDELLKRFPMEQGRQVDIQRGYRLMDALGGFVLSMDQLVWQIWRELAPRSRIKKEAGPSGDLRALGGRYLSGDTEVSIDQINKLIDRLRQLTAGILAGIPAAGRAFSHKFVSRFSPDAIRDLAKLESGWLVNNEQKCWRKYSELAVEISEDAMEAEILAAIARYAEDMIGGASTPGA